MCRRKKVITNVIQTPPQIIQSAPQVIQSPQVATRVIEKPIFVPVNSGGANFSPFGGGFNPLALMGGLGAMMGFGGMNSNMMGFGAFAGAGMMPFGMPGFGGAGFGMMSPFGMPNMGAFSPYGQMGGSPFMNPYQAGFQQGYNQGYASGFQQGYNQAFMNNGMNNGWNNWSSPWPSPYSPQPPVPPAPVAGCCPPPYSPGYMPQAPGVNINYNFGPTYNVGQLPPVQQPMYSGPSWCPPVPGYHRPYMPMARWC